jgi:hypothetical protein
MTNDEWLFSVVRSWLKIFGRLRFAMIFLRAESIRKV